jgi:streptomycin 6-kinase
MDFIDISKCEKNIIDIHGEKGAAWLKCLPELVAECAARWALDVLPPFDYDAFSYVCPAIMEGKRHVVLKLGIPNPEIGRQVETLKINNGDGMVLLMDTEPERGIMLMEHILPGTMLASLEDDEQMTEVAANIMHRIWKPVPPDHHLTSVEQWTHDLETLPALPINSYGPFPGHLIDKGRALFKELLGTGEPPSLLHGDANPYNILKAERQPWLMIDPKGVVGHPLYDVATFLNNLPEDRPASELKAILARRISQFSEILGFERELVKCWGQAHCILAGYWTYEDHGEGWQPIFEIAGLYESV